MLSRQLQSRILCINHLYATDEYMFHSDKQLYFSGKSTSLIAQTDIYVVNVMSGVTVINVLFWYTSDFVLNNLYVNGC